MSMFISSVNHALDIIHGADQAAGNLGQQLTTGRKIQSPQDDPSTWLEATRADSVSTYLDSVHTGLVEVTTTLGVVDNTMQAIASHLEIMQGQLQEALTTPVGDPTRQLHITTFNNVKQQIDDMVNTAYPDGARHLMSDPAVDPQAGDIQVLAGANGVTRTVHAQEVDTGANGLNVPALDPVLATDDDLQAAIANLTTAQSTLASRQMGLGADTAAIQKYATQASQTSTLYRGQADSITTGDPAESVVELQSVQMQRSLAVQALASISTDRNAVLGLLR